MNAAVLVEAISAGVVAGVTAGGVAGQFWARHSVRQRQQFRRDVQVIVDQSVSAITERQAEFERRQGQHLDRQDRKLDTLTAQLTRRRRSQHR